MTDSSAPADRTEATSEGPIKSNKWLVFIVIAVLSLVADQATKVWARAALPVGRIDRSTATCVIPDDMMPRHIDGEPTDRPPLCRADAAPVIDGFWHWRLSMNPGSAFGLFSSQGGARIGLSVVGIVAVLGMLWMLRKARPNQKILHWALALVAGGAVGNLIDRVYFGVVTDFILWHVGTYNPHQLRWEHEWPVFNVADVVLVVGVILMFLDIQKEGRREKLLKAGLQTRAKAAGLIRM
jgi:signal peptidase II